MIGRLKSEDKLLQFVGMILLIPMAHTVIYERTLIILLTSNWRYHIIF